MSSSSPDDGTEPTGSFLDAGGEFIEVVNVRRSLRSAVTFAEWGHTGRNIEVVSGLEALHGGVRTIVDTFADSLR
jgi:hypothetical protein